MGIQSEFPILFWSGMVKDSSLWWDGWYWAVVGTETTGGAPAPSRRPPATTGCAERGVSD